MSAEPPTLDRHGNPVLAFAGRFLLWTFLCWAAAAPSFLIAAGFWDPAAMALGVFIFIIAYTIISDTPRVRRMRADPVIRRTFRIGYGTRVVISVFYPVGGILDVLTGFVTMGIAGLLSFPQADFMTPNSQGDPTFIATLVTTLIHGTLMNLVLGVYMLIIYGLQRLFIKKKPKLGLCEKCEYDLRGSRHSALCPECGHPTPWSAEVAWAAEIAERPPSPPPLPPGE